MNETLIDNTAGDSGADNEQTSQESSWRDGLTDTYRDKYTEFKSADDLMKGYEGLVTKLGTNPIVRPKDGASDEEVQQYRESLASELGRPDDVSGYEFTLPEGAPDDFVDDDLMGKMKDIAFKNGVSGEAFNEMASNFLSEQFNTFNELSSQQDSMESATETLKSEWGNDFDKNLEQASNFAKLSLSEKSIDSLGNNPDFIQAMYELSNKTKDGKIDTSNPAVVKSSPDELRAQARELMKHEAYRDNTHPEHKQVNDKIRKFFQDAAQMVG